jgi:hypothetical protein
LIRPFAAARPEELAAAEVALGRPLPGSYASFLRSFDGADLFHEAIVLGGVGADAPRSVLELNPVRPAPDLVFAEAVDGDRFALADDGHVVRLRAEPEAEAERWRAGSDFPSWLDATVAHERVLYGPDGEFAPEAFEPESGEIAPIVALRQAERALRVDPGAAEAEHERGVALRRLGRLKDSAEAFRRAGALDPPNPWPWFDLGRVSLAMGSAGARQALDSFEAAAQRVGGGPDGARLWAWAARAAAACVLPERLARCRQEALDREPRLGDSLRRARDSAARASEDGDGDPDELHEAEALLEALEGAIPRGRLRLPTVSAGEEVRGHPGPGPVKASRATSAPRRPPPAPPGPRRAGKPPPGGRPRARTR